MSNTTDTPQPEKDPRENPREFSVLCYNVGLLRLKLLWSITVWGNPPYAPQRLPYIPERLLSGEMLERNIPYPDELYYF